ncbi:MAG: IS200/IS605 family transposase [Bacteroidota bacterium]
MANTYTQMYVQIVFAVKGRANLIQEQHRIEIEKYICGIILNKKSKPLAIYCNPDHVHIFIGINPLSSVSDLTRDIKANSSKFINENKWATRKFNWQNGFGAFTYSKSHIDRVVQYILNQPKHHGRNSFKKEYLCILKNLNIDYDDQYLFEWYD